MSCVFAAFRRKRAAFGPGIYLELLHLGASLGLGAAVVDESGAECSRHSTATVPAVASA